MRLSLGRGLNCIVLLGYLVAVSAAWQTTALSQTESGSTPTKSIAMGSSQAQVAPSIPSELNVRLQNVEESKPWYKNWFLLAAVIGWLVALAQFGSTLWWQREERMRQHLLDSLKWFGGNTQPRSIGIAIVTANWNRYPFMRQYWTAVLTNQAIHLLARSKEANSRVEEANLDRIMMVITRPDAELVEGDRRRLVRILNERKGWASPRERRDRPSISQGRIGGMVTRSSLLTRLAIGKAPLYQFCLDLSKKYPDDRILTVH